MIVNSTELVAALDYSVKLADALEGMRRHAQEAGASPLLPVSMEGPLAHLRENLADIRAYAERLASLDATVYAKAAAMTFGIGIVPLDVEQEKEVAAR